jgi:hypothetical protein
VRRTIVVFTLIVFSLAAFLPFCIGVPAVHGQAPGYSLQNVNHNVKVLHSGHVVVTDIIQVSGQLPTSLQVGFPYKYGQYLLKTIAYDNNNKTLPLTLGIPLQSQNGFYSASVSLPDGTSNMFTVVFIFSNSLISSTFTGFSLDFPGYPSLGTTVGGCTVTLNLPDSATNVKIDKNDGGVNGTIYTKLNLPAFTSSPATASFYVDAGYLQPVNIQTVDRELIISSSGEVACTDSYKIVGNSTNSLSSFAVNLPADATNIVGRDQLGRTLSVSIQSQSKLTQEANVTFAVAMGFGESGMLRISYDLPKLTLDNSGNFAFSLDLFPYFNYYVDSASVKISPPEGATIVAPTLSSIGNSADLSREAFQETLTIKRLGISYVDSILPSEDTLQVSYNYSPLWIAFRPTSWMFAITLIGVVIVAFWRRPSTPTKESPRIEIPTGSVELTSNQVKDFIEAYEERGRITSELKSLEARVQRGRIPRRRYKVQKRNTETRLNALNKTINNLKEIFRNTGGSYADVVKQLDSVEVEIKEINLNTTTIENRHNVGELALEEYRKQLTDLERRKEKAETKINGLMLRLRGEIR